LLQQRSKHPRGMVITPKAPTSLFPLQAVGRGDRVYAPPAVLSLDISRSPPLECIFGHIPFSRRWGTVRYSGIQLDTARYVRIQLDTAGYSGSAAKWIDVESIQGYKGYKGYGERQGGMQVKYRRDIPKIHDRGGLLYTYIYLFQAETCGYRVYASPPPVLFMSRVPISFLSPCFKLQRVPIESICCQQYSSLLCHIWPRCGAACTVGDPPGRRECYIYIIYIYVCVHVCYINIYSG